MKAGTSSIRRRCKDTALRTLPSSNQKEKSADFDVEETDQPESFVDGADSMARMGRSSARSMAAMLSLVEVDSGAVTIN